MGPVAIRGLSLPGLAGEGPRWLGIGDRCWVKGGPLRRGQGCLGSLALLFGFKHERESDKVTGIVTKELGSETGTLSPLHPPTPGRVWEVGEQGGEQGEAPGSPFNLQSQKDCSAPRHQPVSQPSKVAQGSSAGASLSFKVVRQSPNTDFPDSRGPRAAFCVPGAPSRVPAH